MPDPSKLHDLFSTCIKKIEGLKKKIESISQKNEYSFKKNKFLFNILNAFQLMAKPSLPLIERKLLNFYKNVFLLDYLYFHTVFLLFAWWFIAWFYRWWITINFIWTHIITSSWYFRFCVVIITWSSASRFNDISSNTIWFSFNI